MIPMTPGSESPGKERKEPVSRIASLISALGDPDVANRSDALDALIDLGTDAVPALVAALHSPKPEVHLLAGVALGKIGTPVIPALVE